MNDLVDFLRDAGAHVALLVAGVVILAAEVWLLTIGESLLLVAGLLVSTGLTEYVLGREFWEDWV